MIVETRTNEPALLHTPAVPRYPDVVATGRDELDGVTEPVRPLRVRLVVTVAPPIELMHVKVLAAQGFEVL